MWFSGSYGTERGAQFRLVLGNIPRNRSDLAGEFTSPGANDISRYSDQTVRSSVGASPAFGLLAAAPNAFLDERVGSVVVDLQFQENIRIAGRAALRLGDVGPASQTWVAVGAFHNLADDESGMTMEVGAKLGSGTVRILSEVKEDPNIGLLFTIPF
jgi:hypothetical protein